MFPARLSLAEILVLVGTEWQRQPVLGSLLGFTGRTVSALHGSWVVWWCVRTGVRTGQGALHDRGDALRAHDTLLGRGATEGRRLALARAACA